MNIIRAPNKILLLLSPILIGLFSIHLGSDTNGDVWNYHWYNAWACLHHRLGQDLEPAGAHSYFNPYLDVFNYILITKLPLWLDAFVVGTIHGLVIWPIYGITRLVFDKSDVSDNLVLLLVLLCLLNPLFLGEVGLGMHDNMIALFAMSGFFILLYSTHQPVRLQYLAAAATGALLGTATGLKLTAAIYAVALLVVTPILLGNSFIARLKLLWIYGLVGALALIATTGIWDWRLYKLYGNPIFPFFNNIFHSPYAVTSATATRDMFFFQEHGLQKLLYPFYFGHNIHLIESTPSKYTMYLATLAYICLPTFIVLHFLRFRHIRITHTQLSLFVYMAVSYLVWLQMFGVSRYLIPTILLFPILIFLSLNTLLRRQSQRTPHPSPWAAVKELASSSQNWIILLIAGISLFDLKEGPATWGRGNLISPYYSADSIAEIKNADVLILQGYPVGWIIPPLNPKGHIIHAGPTLFHFETKKYFDLGRSWVDQAFAQGKSPILIFDISHHNSIATIPVDIARYGLAYSPSTCKPFIVHMGGHTGNMRYCQTYPLSHSTSSN